MMHICHHRQIEIAMRRVEAGGRLTRAERLRLEGDCGRLADALDRARRILDLDDDAGHGAPVHDLPSRGGLRVAAVSAT